MANLRFVLAVLATGLALLLIAPVVLLGLPFLAVAALTRRLARRLEPASVGWEALIDFDPAVGWRPRPNLDGHYLTAVQDDVYHIATGADGWPATASLAESDVVVFGDSYAFGYGVDLRSSFALVRPEARTTAIGAPGYNMVQELLLLREMAPRLAGKLVVWWIYLGNDLFDNLHPAPIGYRAPFVRQRAAGWEIVTEHLHRERWSLSRHPSYGKLLAELCGPGFLSERAYSACAYLLEEGRELCRAAGAELVVMTIPSALQIGRSEPLESLAPSGCSVDPGYPDQQIHQICGRLGVKFVAAREFLQASHYKQRDPHWNEAGHRRIAQLLSDLRGARAVESRTASSRDPASASAPAALANAH